MEITLMDTQQMLKNLQSLKSNVANDVWPNGATMECKICGEQQHLTTAECGRCLFGAGWPKHCGQTMSMVSEQPKAG